MKLEIHKNLSKEVALRGKSLSRYYNIYNQRISFIIPHYMLTDNVLTFTR
jgi:hypothetical protein